MKRTALVLSGGGAGGAFQVGVLKKIWGDEKLLISEIYGTSVGALNATAVKYIGIKGMEEIWRGIADRGDVLKFNYLTLLGLSRGKYKTDPLRKVIDSVLSHSPLYPNLKVFVSTVDLLSGDVEYTESVSHDFKTRVLASACVPFHMEPVGNLVDGGVRDHTPISEAVANGADRVIVICNNPISRKQRDVYTGPKWPYLIDIGLRCTDILQSEVLYGDLLRCFLKFRDNVKLEIYAPSTRIIDTFEYCPEKIAAAIEQGYNSRQIEPVDSLL
jgi:predicted acylesterase/phospholipase RssA